MNTESTRPSNPSRGRRVNRVHGRGHGHRYRDHRDDRRQTRDRICVYPFPDYDINFELPDSRRSISDFDCARYLVGLLFSGARPAIIEQEIHRMGCVRRMQTFKELAFAEMIMEGRIDVLRSIFSTNIHKLDANKRFSTGMGTPLYVAIKHEQYEIAEILIQEGANINEPVFVSGLMIADKIAKTEKKEVLERQVNFVTSHAGLTKDEFAKQAVMAANLATNASVVHGEDDMDCDLYMQFHSKPGSDDDSKALSDRKYMLSTYELRKE